MKKLKNVEPLSRETPMAMIEHHRLSLLGRKKCKIRCNYLYLIAIASTSLRKTSKNTVLL